MLNKYLNYWSLYFDEDAGDNAGAQGADDKGKPAPADKGKPAADPKPAGNDGNGDDRDAPKYSDADLDRIIEKKLAKWKRQSKAEADEAAKLASMTAQERAEHERDQLQKELNDLKRANTIAEMEKTARNILATDNINVPDEIVSTLVDEDADTTSENVKKFAKAFKKAVQDEVKRQLTHKNPSSGSSAGTLTKDDIRKEPDARKRQQMIRDNMALFRNNK